MAAVITAFLVLGAVAAYLTLNFKDILFVNSEAVSESEFHFQTESRKTADKTDVSDTQADYLLIWVGDSRTVGMSEAVADECVYIAASGEGYDWFCADGEAQMRDAIAEYPDAPVVFNLGVNDYDNLDFYMEKYRALTEELPDTGFYFLSVNPIDPAVCKNITNEEISDFNRNLKENFPDTYLDSYTWMLINELSPFDGVHYTKEAYQMLHDYVMEQI
jgi:hypothetical protein